MLAVGWAVRRAGVRAGQVRPKSETGLDGRAVCLPPARAAQAISRLPDLPGEGPGKEFGAGELLLNVGAGGEGFRGFHVAGGG